MYVNEWLLKLFWLIGQKI